MTEFLPPPQFEISDLSIPASDPRYAAAVKCVQTYWKQATSMTESQILRYLGYLSRWNLPEYIPLLSQTAEPNSLMARASTHKLYPKRTAKGAIVKNSGSWTGYMLISSLYENLPSEYLESIRTRFGSATIKDHTDEYRRLYPAPIAQKESTPIIIDITTPVMDITMSAETTTTTPSATQSAVPGALSIDNVIDTMSPSNKKRLGCEPERSAAKRAKADSNEMLQKVNQQAEVIQRAIDMLQANHDKKLQEMREAIEENKQALNAMQGELRQFMSAVATTLRDIQERLDE